MRGPGSSPRRRSRSSSRSALAAAACSSSKSATDKVCASRSQLQSAVDAVQSDVSSGNFGDARNALSDVQTAFDQLESDVAELKADEKSKLQPQIDAIVTSISGLRNAGSLGELQADVATIRSQFQTLSGDLADDLHCS